MSAPTDTAVTPGTSTANREKFDAVGTSTQGQSKKSQPGIPEPGTSNNVESEVLSTLSPSAPTTRCNVPKLTTLVGNTPLVQVDKLLAPYKYSCQVYAKCEFQNPSGSSWDRLMVSKIRDINKLGQLFPNTHFVTGGNGEICKSLAWAGAAGNFHASVLPDSSDTESNLLLLKGYGANVILSYRQDPSGEQNRTCLVSHMKQLESTSQIFHHIILPFANEDSIKVYQKEFAEEIAYQLNSVTESNSSGLPFFDLIVFGGNNTNLVYGLVKSFGKKTGDKHKHTILVGVNFEDNKILEEDEDTNLGNLRKSVIWVTVPDAEAVDMTRRLVREEGLTVGHNSGAVMAAAMRVTKDFGLGIDSNAKVLVILPDGLVDTPSNEFFSTEWMVEKGYYDENMLESLLWWYDMALENVNPPVVMTVPPDAPINIVWKAMGRSLTQRAVVVQQLEGSEKKAVMGVVTYDDLTNHVNSGREDLLVRNVCYTQFGVIDSKQSLTDLDGLLRKFHWVIKMHRVTYYGNTKEPQLFEDVIGVLNLADFMRFKRKIEAHHLREYGITMADGVPSQVWVDKFSRPSMTDTAAKSKREVNK